MTAPDRLELDAIRDEQTRLRRSVDSLDHRIDLLGRRLENSPAAKVEAPQTSEPPPLPTPGEPVPVLSLVRSAEKHSGSVLEGSPPPLPQPAIRHGVDGAMPSRSAIGEKPLADAGGFAVKTPTPQPPNAARDVIPSEPLELRVGTFWMARIGIVILLTGLVFLGNFAYQHIIAQLEPWGKLSLLALAGTGLAGLGAWLERSRETMRNYARVLMAGGAATLYYTAYAAHFVDRLRVIESPIIGGTLLLAMAGGFIWYADKKRSEALAMPGLLLAYYTSAINAIGGFTLFSNLLLTGAAVFFLVRHRWTRISYASLVATYGSYAFWRFHQVVQTGGGSEFGMGLAFLAGYWVLFTAAVFLTSPDVLRKPERLAFLTANNGALFAFAMHHFAVHRPDALWIFTTGFGAVLLGLAALAAWRRTEDRALDGAYLAQGLALFTLGLAQRLTGPQFAVVLAVQSVVLLISARQRHAILCEIASALCAIGACSLAVGQMALHQVAPVALGGSVAALLFADAWLAKRREHDAARFSERTLGFAVLGLIVIGAVLWHAVPAPWQPTAFALAACASLGALRLRLPEIALTAQSYLPVALCMFVARYDTSAAQPWWMPVPLVGAAIALMHWWQRQTAVSLSDEIRAFAQLACASIAIAAGVYWMRGFFPGEAWLVATSAAALGTLLYGMATGAWALAAAGQMFSLLATTSFANALVTGHPAWAVALVPIANLAASSFIATQIAARRFPALPGGATFPLIAQVYRMAALVMLGGWAFEYVDAAWRVAFFAGGGAGLILLGAATRNSERATAGAIFAAAGLALFWMRLGHGVAVQDLIAILAVPASLRLARRLAIDMPVLTEARNALVAAAMASVWLWVTRWTTWNGDSGRLTAVWALLALAIFAAGLGLRERVYRIGGFAVLGLAVARLFSVDVWSFDTLYRIVSFLVLGAVLLTLSFVYNRFSETLRRWL